MKKQFYPILALFAIGFTSCEEDPESTVEPITSSVLIANEGAFQGGTGSLIAYSTGSKTIEKNIFQKANFTSAGNVLNEVYVDGDRTFLTMNVSGTVIMCNTSTMKVEARFEDLGSPRKVMHAEGDKYYATDWTSNVIHVLNAATKTVEGTIVTGVGPETMLKVGDQIFVTNGGGFAADNTVFIIDIDKDEVVDSIVTPDNPVGIVQDKNDLLWILCAGLADFNNPGASTPATLLSYNLDSAWVEDSLVFDDNTKKPLRLTIDGSGSTIYFLDDYLGDLYKMSVTAESLPTAAFKTGSFYGLGYDQANDEIYISDPLDFNSNGDVYRFSTDGSLIDQFKAALIPGTFAFVE
jgi:YVTN family beta-propeller protein